MGYLMLKHVRIVSMVLVIFGVLYLFAAVVAVVFGLIATYNQSQLSDISILPAVLTGGIILLPLVVIGALHILTARAFRKEKSWSRTALWILAILNLGNVPLGTGFGVYAIWVLVNTRETVE